MTDTAAPSGPTPYEQLGGEGAARSPVERFYDLIDLEPAYAGIRSLHPPTPAGPVGKLFWFLSGWLGGPPVYAEKIGHPMLRARHLPYSIGVGERDQWLRCMSQAMDEEGVDPALQRGLAEAFFGTADWMRNTPG